LVWFKERYDFLWVQISKVDAELAIAQRDFADRAFVPFWSAAEKAAKALDLYMAGTLEMAKQARLYEECLTGREHNFPAWNSEIEWLPVPEGYVEQIRVLLRRADQDYEFSSIHQQRVIQKILLVGFEEVGKAILHLEGEMVKSIEGLRRALKADLTRLIYSQEAIRKILVNIATGGSKSNWSGE
ncbi:MAG: hypothetical protein SX243_20705, partial [Acidobacteriota bacterium]|nr:hypothetical protein [Acidobacteriota bacterium]